MYKVISLFLMGSCLGLSMAHAEENLLKYRMDCRFYGEHSKFCYSSAIYNVLDDKIVNIKYGVGCDYETIYNDDGTATPATTAYDSLRPRTAAIPKVEITPQGSLKHPGTYTSRLELSSGVVGNGLCYVSEVLSSDPY